MLKDEIPLPCIAYWRQRHFLIVYAITNDFVYVADPSFGLIKYKTAEFLTGWYPKATSYKDIEQEGIILVLEPTTTFFEFNEKDEKQRTGFGFFLPFIEPYKKLILQLLIGLLISSVIQLIFPFLTQTIVDVGISQNNLSIVNLILIGQLVLFTVQTITATLRSWLLLHITSRINITLLSNFLIKLMNLPISYFDSKSTGDLLQRIQDNSRIQNFLSSTTLNVIFSSFSIIIFGSVIFYYSTWIFLVLVASMALNFFWVTAFLKKRAILDYKRFDQAAGNQSSTLQLLNGMQEIKLNGSEKRRRWEWQAIQVKLFKLSIKSLSLSQLQDIGSGFIQQLMNIIITFLAATYVINGQFSLGAMLSILFIVGQLNVPINSMVGFLQSYQDAKISLERLNEIFRKDNEINLNNECSIMTTEHCNISFLDVWFRYGSSATPWVLQNISVIVPKGKVTAIVGASGSGKTTLLKLLLQYYKPSEGVIKVGQNKTLSDINPILWRKNVGVVMQDGYIFSDTIARNITESDSDGVIDKTKLRYAVQIANIEEFIETLPNNYQTRIGASGMALSGGEKQRILIARAVYKNPEYLFFDEATSALDANNEAKIIKNLADFYKDRTVIVVAHRLSTVINADQILVLDKGSIIEHGTHSELTTLKGRYYELIKNQLELGL
jgi:ATP-binding cassette subfamily B protein